MVRLAVATRATLGGALLLLSQSAIFGLAVLPALLFWQGVRGWTRGFPYFDPYGWYAIVAMSLIPAYIIFSVFLMFLSASWNKLMRWRTTPGEHVLHDYSWTIIRWASYNASISVVRIFCGEAMRATPLWTFYLKANGAKIGKGVYVNTARLNDHNLLVLEDKAVVGGDAKLIAHLVEHGRVKAWPVRVGKRAVIGINTVVGPGVEIGDNSAVGAMSFVPKGTKIPANEAWGGVPARPIKHYAEDEFEKKGQPGIPIGY
jgi:acetyltransferase-like isoleucine patch superfamily enzyme